MSNQQDPTNFSVVRIQHHRGDENKVEVLFNHNGKFFNVILSDRPLPGFDGPDDVACRYIKRMDDLDWDGGMEDEPEGTELKYELLLKEIEDHLQRLGQPIFQELAPAIVDHQKQDLHSFMNPETFNFQLVTSNGDPRLIKRDEIPPPCFHPPMQTLISARLPSFSSSSIEVLQELHYSWVLKVFVDGQLMCCKLTNQAGHDSLMREYDALQRILDAKLPPSIRLPILKGVVKSNEGDVVGILINFIQTATGNLADVLRDTVAKDRREKWASQIQTTLEELHRINVVWGDVKLSNILIDEDDNAWIVDFGGGQTIGWVDTALVGSKQGDLQALEKILESLSS